MESQENKWLAAYIQDGVELTRDKLEGGMMSDRHAMHAAAWLRSQDGSEAEPKPKTWRKALKVSAAAATIAGAVAGVMAALPE